MTDDRRKTKSDRCLSELHAALSRAISEFAETFDPTPARWARAHEAARRALELDPAGPEGHRALGEYYYRVVHDHERALEELTRAAERLPNDAGLASWIGGVMRNQGRFGEALAQFEKAFQLDPRNPGAVHGLAFFCRLTRRYQESVRYYGLLIALQPDTAGWYTMQSAVYLDWGRPKEAREALERGARQRERGPQPAAGR